MNKLRIVFREFAIVQKGLLLVAFVAILAIGAFFWLRSEFPLPCEPELRVKYLEQYVGLVQLIAVGIVVALVSIIIPMMLPEAKDKFERYKESRQAYSRAKTAVIYLPDKVASVNRKTAFQFVEDAHRELHLAETFKDMIITKNYLNWFKSPNSWISYNYWQIIAVAEVLRKFDWNATDNSRDRLRIQLSKTVDVVHGCFGKVGEKIKVDKWDLKDDLIREKEVELENDIKESIKEFS